jgi:hypothetical protein
MMNNKDKNSTENEGVKKKDDAADVTALNNTATKVKDSQNKDKNASNAQTNKGHYTASK